MIIGSIGTERRRMGLGAGVAATRMFPRLRARMAAVCPNGSRWLAAGHHHNMLMHEGLRSRVYAMKVGNV